MPCGSPVPGRWSTLPMTLRSIFCLALVAGACRPASPPATASGSASTEAVGGERLHDDITVLLAVRVEVDGAVTDRREAAFALRAGTLIPPRLVLGTPDGVTVWFGDLRVAGKVATFESWGFSGFAPLRGENGMPIETGRTASPRRGSLNRLIGMSWRTGRGSRPPAMRSRGQLAEDTTFPSSWRVAARVYRPGTSWRGQNSTPAVLSEACRASRSVDCGTA